MKFISPGKESISPNHSRKISECLMEFALEIAPADSARDTFANAVGMAAMLWNVPVLPEAEQARSMDVIRSWLAQIGRLDLQLEIGRLLELRRKRYATDRRVIMNYKLEYGAKGPELIVASVDLDRPENQGR
ncbi:hypothetical protein LBMAG56_15340 [Verrucomicrobiota bacterium]|nr:hypothetical protein LBMAG56_15340 [Verrucomicrobiota bacterium]